MGTQLLWLEVSDARSLLSCLLLHMQATSVCIGRFAHAGEPIPCDSACKSRMRHIRRYGCWRLIQLIQQHGCAMLLIDATHADNPCDPNYLYTDGTINVKMPGKQLTFRALSEINHYPNGHSTISYLADNSEWRSMSDEVLNDNHFQFDMDSMEVQLTCWHQRGLKVGLYR